MKILFGAYRLDQYPDAESFMLQCAAILADYPVQVVVYVSDPRTGIQRTNKFPPALAEIVGACDERLAYLHRQIEHEQFQARKSQAIIERSAQQRAIPLREGEVDYKYCIENNIRPVGRFERSRVTQQQKSTEA